MRVIPREKPVFDGRVSTRHEVHLVTPQGTVRSANYGPYKTHTEAQLGASAMNSACRYSPGTDDTYYKVVTVTQDL